MFAGGGKRDGLTVDRHPEILVKKMAPFAPARLLGPGRADLHLGRGGSPRPDTLMQTDQIIVSKPLAKGARHTFF